jgi:hypothetical protein
MGAIGIRSAQTRSMIRYIGQFIDWVTPLLAFAVFIASETVVIYYFLKVIGAMK